MLTFLQDPVSQFRVIKGRVKRLRWSRSSVLHLRGSKPAEAVRIFQGKKILSTPSYGGEVKLSVPCRGFAACKRSLNETRESTFRQNYRPTFSPTVPPFAARISRDVWTWRHLAAEVGTSKNHWGDEGHTISHIGCGASGAYAPGPDDKEEEERQSSAMKIQRGSKSFTPSLTSEVEQGGSLK
jgi:hypothetical protein